MPVANCGTASLPRWWAVASTSSKTRKLTVYRPRILVNEDSLTVGGASIRGEWYKARMLGEARTTEITVAGWREQGDSGPLWQTNRLVDIDDSIQNLKTTWLISGVTWTDGAQGRMTVLALVPALNHWTCRK